MFDESRNIIINENEAKWVRDIYQMYVSGQNTASIADYLESNSIPTLTGNGRWSSSSIRRILKNEKYCGDILLQKTYTDGPITQRRLTNNGVKEKYLLSNVLPQIVSRELWEACQKKMSENATIYKIGKKNCKNLTTAFTGFGFCPYCRNSYFRKFNRKVEMLYCSSNKSRRMCTDSESVFIDDLKKIIPILVKKLKVNESEFKKELVKAFSETNSDEGVSVSKEINDLTSEIALLRDKYADYAKLDGDAFDSVRKEIKRSIEVLENKRILLENQRITNFNPESRATSIIKELRKFPDEDDIGDYDFRKLFKQMIVINRDRLIFVIGSDDMNNLPRNPNKIPMMFIESYTYKVRSTTSTCYFGICINK